MIGWLDIQLVHYCVHLCMCSGGEGLAGFTTGAPILIAMVTLVGMVVEVGG